jgi:hypothetical protein
MTLVVEAGGSFKWGFLLYNTPPFAESMITADLALKARPERERADTGEIRNKRKRRANNAEKRLRARLIP